VIQVIVGGVVYVVLIIRNYLIRQTKLLFRTISRSAFVGQLRLLFHHCKLFLLCEEEVSEKTRHRKHDPNARAAASTVSTKTGVRVTTGEWRNELKIKHRDKNLKMIMMKINTELANALLETVSDHALVIDHMLDSVVDTSGYVLLICQYRYTRLWFTYLLPVELILYAAMGALSNYYLDWQDRAYLLLGFHCFMIFITYAIQPYWSVIDRWIDWAGRVMIIFVAYGLIISDQSSSSFSSLADDDDQSTASGSGSTSYLDTGNRRGFNKLVYVISEIWHLLTSSSNSSKYLILDVCMVAYVYLYVLNILSNIGVFRYIARKLRQYQYAMHDYIVDFLVAKIDERSMGVENMHVGLPLVQQWDDIIKDQRRYGVIPYPDVRPASLLTIKQKLIEVKWASFFNLTISNMRTSLGLTLLHIVMCSADPEITRWLIHCYPHLLSQEDFQRDTPISIALKECAYYLLLYANINDGEMDDGTTFADDDFYSAFPDVLTMREEVKYHGEIIPEAVVSYEMTATERKHLKEFGFFIEQEPHKRTEIGLTPVGLHVPTTGSSYLGGPSLFAQGLAKKRQLALNQQSNQNIRPLSVAGGTGAGAAGGMGRKFSTQSVGLSSQIHVKRYPEDDFYDNFEGGQAAGWILLNIDVSENLIDNENYGSDSDFDSDEEDLRYGIMESFQYKKAGGGGGGGGGSKSNKGGGEVVEFIPDNHPLLLPLTEKGNMDYATGYDLILRKKEVKHLTKRDGVTWKSLITNNPFGLQDKEMKSERLLLQQQQKQQQGQQQGHGSGGVGSDSFNAKNQEILWRLCKYADIFLSDQIFAHCFEMGWNISTYKDLNKMSSKLQGLVSQHLAVCFNLNPPSDFVRFSDWSTGIVENIREEYGAYDDLHGTSADADGDRGGAGGGGGGVGSAAIKGLESFTSMLISRKKGTQLNDDVFNDRLVQYLAECYAGSRDEADLSDCDLGIAARVAWRAITRSYRKKTCTFIIPGIFTPPKPILLLKLILQRNELDCGDAVLVADILLNQQTLLYVDMSHNQIASRGVERICLGMKSHQSIRSLYLDHNRIGPHAGKALGAMLKIQQTLQILSISHNRMGDIIRYLPNTALKETLPSAGKYIFFGLKNNKSLMSLDVSYNDLGPSIASIVPLAVSRHPKLFSLNLAGNNIGTAAGVPMVYALSRIGIEVKKSHGGVIDETALPPPAPGSAPGGGRGGVGAPPPDSLADHTRSETGKSEGGRSGQSKKKSCKSVLADLSLADNQFGEALGVPLGQLIKNSTTLTSLDISRNSLGPLGGKSFCHAVSQAYGYTARKLEREIALTNKLNQEKLKNKQLENYKISRLQAGYSPLDDGLSDYDEQEQQQQGGGGGGDTRSISSSTSTSFPRHWKQQILLTHLNISRNNLGPQNMVSLMEALQMPNCTITTLDISNNPLGVSYDKAGKAFDGANALRLGLMKCPCLNRIQMNNLALDPPQILPILGGISNNLTLLELSMSNMIFDEPCCLQFSNAISSCITLQKIEVRHVKMGPKGGALVCSNIEKIISNLKYLDLTGSKLGFTALEPLFRGLTSPSCELHTLYLGDNEMDHEGGMSLCQALRACATAPAGHGGGHGHISSLTDLDISQNLLTSTVAMELADLCKQYRTTSSATSHGTTSGGTSHGTTSASLLKLYKLKINHNPDIGPKASRQLILSLATEWTNHLEFINCSCSESFAYELSKALKDVTVGWKYLDLRYNQIKKIGLNQIFWSLRVNRKLRVLRLGGNHGGTSLGINSDVMGSHGIGLVRGLQENLILRYLDLSYLGLSPESGQNLFTALKFNYSLHSLNLRGNLFDDTVNTSLESFLIDNNVLKELDLGENMKFNGTLPFAIAEGLYENKSLQSLYLDETNFAIAGGSTIEIFIESLLLNHTLRRLNLDGNRMGTQWGLAMAEVITKTSTLRQLSLRNNRYDCRVGKALAQAYLHNMTLMELGVSSEEVGSEAYEEIKRCYISKRAPCHMDDVLEETSGGEEMDRRKRGGRRAGGGGGGVRRGEGGRVQEEDGYHDDRDYFEKLYA
jgi:Ran GTPase-activating protein (RanGAP) involved in mRNA processing and transport